MAKRNKIQSAPGMGSMDVDQGHVREFSLKKLGTQTHQGSHKDDNAYQNYARKYKVQSRVHMCIKLNENSDVVAVMELN